MSPRASICLLVLVVAARAASSPATAGEPPGTFAGCRRVTRPLPAEPLHRYASAVTRTVLDFVRTSLARRSSNPQRFVGARERSARAQSR